MIANILKRFRLNGSRLLISELEPNIRILETIVSSTEKEFLAIGEKIQEFHQRASDISSMASQIAGKISGREMQDVYEKFSQISAITGNLSHGMGEEKNTISVILEHFDALRKPLADFEKVVRNLNVLCNFIKIEIARLGLDDTSFYKLSDDVGRLANVIGQIIKSLVDQSGAAVFSLKENIVLIEKCDERQKVQAALILKKINANLSAISEKNIVSSKTIADISQTWERISQNVGEVVQSLQFHDITRQRVDHAREALEGLPQKLDVWEREKKTLPFLRILNHQDAPSVSAPSGVYRKTDLVADLFDLQAAQIMSAEQGLMEAMERILQSLRFVMKDAVDISRNILLVTGQNGGGQDTFLAQMEKDVNALAGFADEVARIKQDLTAAMSALSETALGMAAFVKDMEKIGIEMQRLAVNARVHAAHLGERGATLGVLAEAIHQLSMETSSMVQSIMSALQAVAENAGRLSGMAKAEGGGRLTRIREDFITILAPLKTMESELAVLLPRMEQSGVLLANDIGDLVDGVHIHEKISSGLVQVVSYLRATVDRVSAAGDKRTEGRKDDYLGEVSGKYTMHSERATHLASTGGQVEMPGAAAAPPTEKILPATPASGNDGGELGDNVELF